MVVLFMSVLNLIIWVEQFIIVFFCMPIIKLYILNTVFIFKSNF